MEKIRTISETLLKKEQKEILFKEISYYLQHKAENCLDVDVEEIEEILNGGKTMIAKGLKKVIERSKQEGFEQGIEEGIEKGIEKGFDKGVEQGTLIMVKRMLKANIQIHQIIEVSGLTETEIEKIKEEMNL